MPMAEPLIPDAARELYGQLINHGPVTPLDRADPRWQGAGLSWLARTGLVSESERALSLLAPVVPLAAFERLFARWQRDVEQHQQAMAEIAAFSVRLQERFVRGLGAGTMTAICQVIVDRWHVAALYDALHGSATSEVADWATGPYFDPTTFGSQPPPDPSTGYLAPDRDLISHGGRARTVYARSTAEYVGAHLENALADGEEIRVAEDDLPMKLLIVDDHTVLIPLRPYGHPALLIRSRHLVEVFRAFFDLVWLTTRPWQPTGVPVSTGGGRSTSHDILALLANGYKDESIARRLGISVRTVRRHVADLMHELGVTNRFAAGVAAVRAGWLDPS